MTRIKFMQIYFIPPYFSLFASGKSLGCEKPSGGSNGRLTASQKPQHFSAKGRKIAQPKSTLNCRMARRIWSTKISNHSPTHSSILDGVRSACVKWQKPSRRIHKSNTKCGSDRCWC